MIEHSCAAGDVVNRSCHYSTKVLAHTLLEKRTGSNSLSMKEATVILRDYTKRPLLYQTIAKVRREYINLSYRCVANRIQRFPALVERLKAEGHNVDYG